MDLDFRSNPGQVQDRKSENGPFRIKESEKKSSS